MMAMHLLCRLHEEQNIFIMLWTSIVENEGSFKRTHEKIAKALNSVEILMEVLGTGNLNNSPQEKKYYLNKVLTSVYGMKVL